MRRLTVAGTALVLFIALLTVGLAAWTPSPKIQDPDSDVLVVGAGISGLAPLWRPGDKRRGFTSIEACLPVLSMARVLIGGLISSTLITLFLVPTLFLTMERVRFGRRQEKLDPAVEPAMGQTS